MSLSLPALQLALQEFVLRGTGPIGEHVRGTDGVPATTRLAIYANAYRTRLTEALESNFPMLARFMGGDEFQRLAYRYIEQHDSTRHSLRWYGDRLTHFLTTTAPYGEVPVLADLARWEWAMTEAFDAADEPTLSQADLAQRAPGEWADLPLAAHPSVRLVDLAWNAPQIWKALQDGAAVPKPECCSPRQRWLLWRQELQIFFRSLTPQETIALEMLYKGEDFGELCEALAAQVGEEQAPPEAARLLRGWVESGLLVSSSPPGDKIPPIRLDAASRPAV